MSPGHRHSGTGADGKDGKPGKGWRRRKDDVSLADRLGGSRKPPPSKAPPGSVLPGQGMPQGAGGGRDRADLEDRPQGDAKDSEKGREKPRAAAPERPAGTVLPGKAAAAPVSRQSRKQLRQQREQQKRRERQRWVLTGLAVLAVVVVGVLLVVWISGGEDEAPVASGPDRVERTLTLTLAPENEPATSGALMIDDPADPSAGSVLIPSRLFVSGPTPDDIPFGDTVLLGSDAAPGDALADTLDVVVDDTWQMSDQMLAKLVDDVGGVLVDVDADVVKGRDIVVAAGDGQVLTGAQAVAFATYLGKDEVEEARLARFSQVLDSLMRKLPDSHDTLVGLFGKVDATQASTLSDDALADFVQSYGDVARGGDATYQSLPTTVLDSGGGEPALSVDPDGLDRLRNGLLADSLPPDAGGDQITVLVKNGVGTPGLDQDAADKLRAAGYDFLPGGNANEFGVKQTVVLIPDSGEASIALGRSVAQSLGVPESAVEVGSLGSSVSDVIVVLGEDFKP